GPCAGGRTRPAVHVQHAGLDLVEEALDLSRILGVHARGQPVDRVVREPQRLVEVLDRLHRGERREQLVLEQAVRGGQTADDGRLDVVAAGQRAVGQVLAADEDGPVTTGRGDG